jgi:GT2 family glycosyltransferase
LFFLIEKVKQRFLPRKIYASLDLPEIGSSCVGNLIISGWAFSKTADIADIQVFIGHTLLGKAQYGLERPDVAAHHSLSKARNSGYIGTFSLNGLESGEQLLAVIINDQQGNSFKITRSIQIAIPQIEGALDAPLEKSITSGILLVSGWAFSPVAPVKQVEVYLASKRLGAISYGEERPDVLKVRPWQQLVRCGYSGRLRFEPDSLGPQTVTVRITDESGNQIEFNRLVEVHEPNIRMHLDFPRPQANTAGLLKVQGWAFGRSAPVVKIYAGVNDKFSTQLPYGFPRPDVEANFFQSGIGNCGFQDILELKTDLSGPQTLVVQAIDGRGDTAEVEVEVTFIKAGQPAAEIERVLWIGSQLEIEGWAVWPNNAPPRTARILLDGQLVGQTRVNLSRPDVAGQFPDNPTAYRCGFLFRQTYSPSEEVVQKPHTLIIQFSDKEGRLFERQTNIVWDPNPNQGTRQTLLIQFEKIMEEYSNRFGTEPSILDWHSNLDLTSHFPQKTIFSPPLSLFTRTLNYIDASIDLIVLDDQEEERLAEARRVAAGAVIVVENSGQLKIEWSNTDQALKNSLPSASIIIPVYNKAHYTKACLQALKETLPETLTVEIIVVDDASTDETERFLKEWSAQDSRLKVIRNSENKGFIYNCNLGAEVACHEILIFLNNDTLPQPGWLPPLLEVLCRCDRAGAVGGKLLYPDGVLQEAGGIIFSDASGHNFGRYDPEADAPLYNYLREVDYCSGALLATPRRLFKQLGGFDTRYSPAYYEDTDYCFNLWRNGYRVYYQPESVIIHFEGVSSGTDVTLGVKRYQLVNQAKFVEKWGKVLANQPKPPTHLNQATFHLLVVREGSSEEEG